MGPCDSEKRRVRGPASGGGGTGTRTERMASRQNQWRVENGDRRGGLATGWARTAGQRGVAYQRQSLSTKIQFLKKKLPPYP